MYVMSYFRTEAEALHLAVSSDGLRWQPVRDGAPVCISEIGERSIRDPFVCRSADGLFHLLGTNSWKSEMLFHAVSTDLLTWREQSLVPVMQGKTGVRNVWAPEAFWDNEAQVWRLVWSSSLSGSNSSSDLNHRIWSCTTTDFIRFTSPALFFDPGYSVIDACVVHDGQRYLMAFKDERGHNPPRHREPEQRKAISIAYADDALGLWQVIAELVTPPLTEGPTLYRLGGQWVMLYDLFVEKSFGAAVSADGISWGPMSMPPQFSFAPRHASVIEVPDTIGEQLLG